MKPALVIASITGGLALAGAGAVGTVYLVSHRPMASAPQPVAQTPKPAPALPRTALETPLAAPPMVRRHAARVCALPVGYHRRARSIVRPIIRTRLHILAPVYGPPIAFGAPPPRGWYARPYWRAGWRGPRWDGLPPRFAYARAPYERTPYARGPYARGPWGGW